MQGQVPEQPANQFAVRVVRLGLMASNWIPLRLDGWRHSRRCSVKDGATRHEASRVPGRVWRAPRPLLTIIATLGLLTAPLTGDAQQAGKTYRIGYLANRPSPSANRYHDALRQGLRDFGYVEGQNLVIEYRWAEGRDERFPSMAAELVNRQVDVIVALGPAVLAAKQATTKVPIVFVAYANPVETGVVLSLAHPGGNVTGLSLMGNELMAKRLEVLKEAIPAASQIAVLRRPLETGVDRSYLEDIERAARSLGVQLKPIEVRAPEDFDRVLALLGREHPQALLVEPHPFFFVHRARAVDVVTRSRVPAMWGMREDVEADALMAYVEITPHLWRRAAAYVDKILKGAKPGDLPVEQPTKFDLVINIRTARTLGLTIPSPVLSRADEVIE